MCSHEYLSSTPAAAHAAANDLLRKGLLLLQEQCAAPPGELGGRSVWSDAFAWRLFKTFRLREPWRGSQHLLP